MPGRLQYFYKLTFLSIALFFEIAGAVAQPEFLVKVNPASGNYSKIDSIPGVIWIESYDGIAVDKYNGHFTFAGGPDQTTWHLITLNEFNGTILYNPPLPGDNSIVALAYSASGVLYGIVVQAGVFSIGTFNIQSGAFSKITDTEIEAAQIVIDDMHGYIYLNGTYHGNFVFGTIDIATGKNILQLPFSNVSSMVYDNTSGKLYAIAHRTVNSTTSVKSFVTINTATGALQLVADLPTEIAGIYQGEQTFDEKNKTYITVAANNNGDSFLYSIDANTGNIIYKAPVDITNSFDKDNVIRYRYDNNLGTLFALHWEAKKINPVIIDSSCNLSLQIKLYPNPFRKVLIIQKNPITCSVRMNLYNDIGQAILKGKIINDGSNQIPLNNISAGTYLYEFYSDNNRVLTGKIIKQ